jgi:hypothetical protein
MRTFVLVLSGTLMGILGCDLGGMKPSFAESQVKPPAEPAPVQFTPLPTPVSMSGAQPRVYSGNGGRSIEPENALCFLQRSDGRVINLTQLCEGGGGVLHVESDPGAERARQMEWHGGY